MTATSAATELAPSPAEKRLKDAHERVRRIAQESWYQNEGEELHYRYSDGNAYDIARHTASRVRTAIARYMGFALLIFAVAVFVIAIISDPHGSPQTLKVIGATTGAAIVIAVAARPWRRRTMFQPVWDLGYRFSFTYANALRAATQAGKANAAANAIARDMAQVNGGLQELLIEFDNLTSSIQEYRSLAIDESLHAPAAEYERRDAVLEEIYDVMAHILVASWVAQETAKTKEPAPTAVDVPTVLTDDSQTQMRQALERLARAIS